MENKKTAISEETSCSLDPAHVTGGIVGFVEGFKQQIIYHDKWVKSLDNAFKMDRLKYGPR